MQISLEKLLVFKRFEKYCIYCVDCSLGTDSFVIILLSLCFVGFCASSGNVNVLLIYLLDGIISLADRHYNIIIILFRIQSSCASCGNFGVLVWHALVLHFFFFVWNLVCLCLMWKLWSYQFGIHYHCILFIYLFGISPLTSSIEVFYQIIF